MTEDRKLMRYVFYKALPEWFRLSHEEKSLYSKELAAVIANARISVHTYSLVGLRADADLGFWEIASSAEELSQFQAEINAIPIGGYIQATHSFLALTRKSQYTKGHKHAGQEDEQAPGPVGSPYLFVYPMDKQRRWYALPFEERRRIMGEHFRIGHKYPNIKIHTGYSFGIDDQEFVVAFEGDSLGEFLDLVEELRGSESSSFTARDVPIFTCIRKPTEDVLRQLG